MKTRLTSLYIILGIVCATCTAQVNSQPQRRIFSGGHELYYEYRAKKIHDIGCNRASFALKADKDIPKQEPENGYIYEQKLWRLIDMPETNLLIDSIRHDIAQMLTEKEYNAISNANTYATTYVTLYFDNDGKIVNVALDMPADIHGPGIRNNKIYAILHHIYSHYTVWHYAQLNQPYFKYNGIMQYSFPVIMKNIKTNQ